MSSRTARSASRLPWMSLKMAIMSLLVAPEIAFQVVGQVIRRRVARGGVGAQAGRADAAQGVRRGMRGERRPAGQQFVQDGPEAPDVGGGRERPAVALFGGHVRRRARRAGRLR